MKDKKIGSVLKTESKVIAYVVICLVIIVLGISYALFFEVKGNEKNQIVKAGTLEFTYANGSQITNATNSDCFIPMNNEEALTHSECEYKISIRNAGTLPGNYSINLSNVSVENPIALNKLKVILKKEGQVVSDYPKEGTTTSLVTNEKIEAGKVINYSVQVYVDKSLAEALDDEKNISLKINGDAVVNSEEINPVMPAVDYITQLSKIDTTNIKADDTGDANIRYIGSSPNNYIDIGDRTKSGEKILWRIIGVMNNITNLDTGKEESLLKIIRAESIGNYSWDSSVKEINDGFGINEWSQADLMKLLNPNTVYNGTPAIGKSLYWNREKGSCYYDGNELYNDCDFTSYGISDEAKNKIAKVKWNTGTTEEAFDYNIITAKYMYEAERSSHNGKELCEGKGYENCNDEVPRTTTWDGYIGLIYPSDFGYAVGGEIREVCLEGSMYFYNTNSCIANDWLKPNGESSWTMTPVAFFNDSRNVVFIRNVGYVINRYCGEKNEVKPVVYLKSSTRILPNPNSNLEYGSKENPFVIQ